MTNEEAWQAGFDAARQWEQRVASFWCVNEYGSPPKAPKNPFTPVKTQQLQYFVRYGYDSEWTDYDGVVISPPGILPPDTDRLLWRWKP